MVTKIIYYTKLLFSALCIALGVSISYVQLTQENGGLPYRENLSEAVGYIDWVQSYKYGIRFSFIDGQRNFNYPSKSNGLGVVKDSLNASTEKLVTILFDGKNTTSPIYSDREYHDVLEVRVGEKVIRSYDDSAKAWKADNLLFPFIVALFLISGPYIGWNTIRGRKNA